MTGPDDASVEIHVDVDALAVALARVVAFVNSLSPADRRVLRRLAHRTWVEPAATSRMHAAYRAKTRRRNRRRAS